jgi:hypothetical protein
MISFGICFIIFGLQIAVINKAEQQPQNKKTCINIKTNRRPLP